MGEIVRLAKASPSKETIESLAALLAEARSGEIVGISYVALQRRGMYTADSVGYCRTARVVTLGALVTLQHRILEV